VTLTERQRALLAALGAYFLWGMSPLYFIAIASVPTGEVVANRIAWSTVLVLGIVFLRGQGPALRRALGNRRHFWGLVGSSICVTINWSFYAWAIPHGHALDAGFGYLVNPLVTVLLGFVVLRENLSAARWIAILLAGLGVGVLAYGQGGVPWVVLVLPATFGLYGLLRKVLAVDAMVGLAVEVVLVVPFAAIYLATRPGGGALLGEGVGMTGMMLLSAAITAVPLFLFSYGARRLPMATMGVLQYVSPTLQLFLAATFFGEAFTWADAAAFGLIWTGIAVYAVPARKAVDNGSARGHIAPQATGGVAPTTVTTEVP